MPIRKRTRFAPPSSHIFCTSSSLGVAEVSGKPPGIWSGVSGCGGLGASPTVSHHCEALSISRSCSMGCRRSPYTLPGRNGALRSRWGRCRDITVSARVQLRIDSLTCGRNSARATPRPLCPARVRTLTGCVVAAERPSTSHALSTPPPIQVHARCPSRGVSLAAKRPHGCIVAAERPSTQCARMASLVRQRSHGASSVSQTGCPHRCIVAAERPSTQCARRRLLFVSACTEPLPSRKQGVCTGVSWLLSARAPSTCG